MKTKLEKLEELANEALNSNDVCSEWKSKINDALGNNKSEFGKWYKCNQYPKWLSFFESETISYGINGNGDWFYYKGYDNAIKNPLNELATYKEVEEALIKEAKRRGYKVGVEFKSLKGPGSSGVKCKVLDEVYFCSLGYLYADGGYIFLDGKWAEIIEEDIIEVNGVKYKKL